MTNAAPSATAGFLGLSLIKSFHVFSIAMPAFLAMAATLGRQPGDQLAEQLYVLVNRIGEHWDSKKMRAALCREINHTAVRYGAQSGVYELISSSEGAAISSKSSASAGLPPPLNRSPFARNCTPLSPQPMPLLPLVYP